MSVVDMNIMEGAVLCSAWVESVVVMVNNMQEAVLSMGHVYRHNYRRDSTKALALT